ncbi:uncharacterized protein LOC100489732 isoform X2 [Xenopus tropicalis]|uniref:Uncharacterized protein LOC100489732 isoform X2 n=1 Tax=Xenopus tropicalis TaxID=8364 RepID=A0A8J0T0E5_XENTR|eukprot:XP_017948993.1 PREDICTED: uncharacterized protein LOC100489732 isoform X2 [Xenopus tropicalis]
MSSSQRLVLVLGGAGTVGSGIVKCLLQKGFRVAVISRDASRLEKIKSFVPVPCKENLYTLLGDVGSEQGAQEAAATLQSRIGKVLETLLLSTFTAWKAFFPLVKDNPDGTYSFITGGAGERLLMPGTGFLTLGAAGALAFSQVVREEYPDVPCKLNEIKINMGVATPERLGPGYVSHLEVGEAIATVVEKRHVSHTVLCVNSTTDLKTLILEGKL